MISKYGYKYQNKEWPTINNHKSQTHKCKKICICTNDAFGIIKNGGIGTSFFHTAKVLSNANIDVTVFFYLPKGLHILKNQIRDAKKLYSNANIKLIISSEVNYGTIRNTSIKYDNIKFWPEHAQMEASFKTYLWLKGKDYQTIIFPDWKGLAFHTVIGKKMGFIKNSNIIIQTHSSELWISINNKSLEGSKLYPLITFQMEKTACKYADYVISPTNYLLTWMVNFGFNFPSNTYKLPYLYDTKNQSTNLKADSNLKITELLFFGRLEERKGLKLFCDSINFLIKRSKVPIEDLKITFLGKIGTCNGLNSYQYISEISNNWPFKLQIINHLDSIDAISYLKASSSRLAIIPSLADNSPLTVIECLTNDIKFITSNIGGIPELIHPDDREKILFEASPDQLSQKINFCLINNIKPAKYAVDQALNTDKWVYFLNSLEIQSYKNEITKLPLVTICLINHNNYHFLNTTLEGINKQTYSNIEVILVDDGSTDEKTVDFINSLKKSFDSKGWKIIFNENGYVGNARNTAASNAKGEYLLFMDNDNYAFEYQVETFVNAIAASGSDVITSSCIYFKSEKDDINQPDEQYQISHIYMPVGSSKTASLYGNTYGDANAIFTKKAFETLGGFTEFYGISYEDYEIIARADHIGLEVLNIPEPLFWLREVQGSVTKVTSNIDNHFRVYNTMLHNSISSNSIELSFLNMMDHLKINENLHNKNKYQHLSYLQESNPYAYLLTIALSKSESKISNDFLNQVINSNTTNKLLTTIISMIKFNKSKLLSKLNDIIIERIASDSYYNKILTENSVELNKQIEINFYFAQLVAYSHKQNQKYWSALKRIIIIYRSNLSYEFSDESNYIIPLTFLLLGKKREIPQNIVSTLLLNFSREYRSLNPDIIGIDPLIHFIKYGRREKRMKPTNEVSLKYFYKFYLEKSELIKCEELLSKNMFIELFNSMNLQNKLYDR